MNDELRRMAEQCGMIRSVMHPSEAEFWNGPAQSLEAFAWLVAADCAKVADDKGACNWEHDHDCGDVIRAKYTLK